MRLPTAREAADKLLPMDTSEDDKIDALRAELAQLKQFIVPGGRQKLLARIDEIETGIIRIIRRAAQKHGQ